MLNKNKILMMAVAGMIANLPSGVSAQTFYQCVPNACSDGYYFNGTGCKKIICPAGTYYSNGSCARCPDFHWSNAGASSCSKMQSSVVPNLDTFCASLPCYGVYFENEDVTWFSKFLNISVLTDGTVVSKGYKVEWDEDCRGDGTGNDICSNYSYMVPIEETISNGVSW